MKRIYSVIGRTRRRWLTLAAALSLASAFLNVWVRMEVGELLDLLGTGTLQISSILANVFSFFLLILVMTFKPYLSAQYLIALKQNLYEAVSRQLMEMKLDTFTGSGAVNTFLSDIESICQAILRLLQKAIGDLGLFLFSIGALFLIHWSLPVIGIICSLLPAIALRITNQPMKKAQDAYRKEEESANESLAFGLSNLESLKAFSLEERAARQAGESFARLQKAARKLSYLSGILAAPSLLSVFAVMLALTLWSGFLTARGIMTGGELFTVLSLTDYLVSPVMGLENTVRLVRQANAGSRQLDAFLNLEKEPAYSRKSGKQDIIVNTEKNKKESTQADRLPLEVCFEHVDFSYGERVILKNFCAEWRAGQCHYIVGPIGSGKTTLMKLITSMLYPDAGKVRVCGRATDCWDAGELRERMAVMPQETILFADTVLENVRLYQESYGDAEVLRVLDKAGLSERIKSLPQGIYTSLSENGNPLSQGEKQRLAFARCILKNPDIYILDEPTASLDAARKEEITERIASLAQDHLVLVITHDRECIRPQDQVTELGTKSRENQRAEGDSAERDRV